MIRLGLLLIIVATLCVVSFRRWYWALCGLLFLTVVTQHPSMPTYVAGIQGLSPWNLVFSFVLVGWFVQRNSEPSALRSCHWAGVLLLLYVLLVVACGVVGAADADSLKGQAAWKFNTMAVLVDSIVNPLKYTTVGVLFYLGARSRERIRWGLFSAIGSSMCYAFLMFKSMGARIFAIDFEDARRLTDKLIGLYANDIGQLLAFAIWGAICVLFMLRRRRLQAALLVVIAAVIPPFVALQSRAGFLAFCCVGLTLGVLRWRWMLVVLPASIIVVAASVPTVGERVMTGIQEGPYEENDWVAISAGRVTNIWPAVIRQIGEAPVFGHGRYALVREDCYDEVLAQEGSVPTHPHNAYLEILLDAGAVGLAIALAWMWAFGRASVTLLRRRGDPLLVALGGVAVAALVALLSAGIAGLSFFPTQSTVPYLCVWGMALRVCRESTVGAGPQRFLTRGPAVSRAPRRETCGLPRA